jgi:hypothetical protein
MRTIPKLLALAVIAGTSLGGCSNYLDVTNPGPIEDTKLQTPDAVPALVVGMSADYANVYDEMVRITAIAGDELGHGGSYTQEGLWVRGIILPAVEETLHAAEPCFQLRLPLDPAQVDHAQGGWRRRGQGDDRQEHEQDEQPAVHSDLLYENAECRMENAE